MKLPCIWLRLLATIVLLSAAPAIAAGTASASITNVRLGVVDLTPNDGSAAGFDFSTIHTVLGALALTDAQYTSEATPLANEPGIARIDYMGAWAEGRTNGELLNLESAIFASSDLIQHQLLHAGGFQRVWLTLRPHSEITFAGSLAIHAERVPEGSKDYDIYRTATAAIMNGSGQVLSEISRGGEFGFDETSSTLAEDFVLGYANHSDSDMTLMLSVAASEIIHVTSIPEPAMFPMLGVGMLLVGIAARRRQHGRAATRSGGHNAGLSAPCDS